MIDNKQELFDYINKEGREDNPIEEMTFFAHGTAFDQKDGIANPEYENQYAIAMGYSHKEGVKHNNNLNIFKSDLNMIDSSAFSKKMYTYFGSCRTGNKFNDTMSFAQAWSNMTGGLVSAATGKNSETGRTDYTYIYSTGSKSNFDLFNSIGDFLSGVREERNKARKGRSFSTSGCLNYPVVNDGGKFEEFYPNFY